VKGRHGPRTQASEKRRFLRKSLLFFAFFSVRLIAHRGHFGHVGHQNCLQIVYGMIKMRSMDMTTIAAAMTSVKALKELLQGCWPKGRQRNSWPNKQRFE